MENPKKKTLKWTDPKIGVFVSVVLFLLFIILFFSDPIEGIFRPTTTLFVSVKNAGGIRVDASVWINGIQVGNVKSIHLFKNGGFLAVTIPKEYLSFIRKNSYAEIKPAGLVGTNIIEFMVGDPNREQVEPYDTIPGNLIQPLENINQAFSSAVNVANTVNRVASSIEQGQGTLGHLINNPDLYNKFTQSVAQLSTILDTIQNGKGTASSLINDPALYSRANRTIAQLSSLINSAQSGSGTVSRLISDSSLYKQTNTAIEQLTSLLERLETGNGTAGTVISDTSMSQDLKQVVSDFHLLIQDIMKNPKKYFSVSIF